MTAQEILFNHLLKKEVMVVFDVDGVLAPYEFGDKKHLKYCISILATVYKGNIIKT